MSDPMMPRYVDESGSPAKWEKMMWKVILVLIVLFFICLSGILGILILVIMVFIFLCLNNQEYSISA